MKTTYCDSFEATLPTECVNDCSCMGDNSQAVEYWSKKLSPNNVTPNVSSEQIIQFLSNTGAWEDGELKNAEMNFQRLIWLASHQIKEEENDQ
jgi:hypothetical protein